MDQSIGSMLTKTQRLILGSFVLLVVDIIWVSSSELTKVTHLFLFTIIQSSIKVKQSTFAFVEFISKLIGKAFS